MVHQLATEEMTKELKDLFKRMDKSGDGRLSLQELIEGFREVMKSQGRENVISEEEITKRFNDIDIDHSKFIEIEEFRTMFSKAGLSISEIWGEYDGSPFSKETSSRLIFIGKK